AVVAKRFRFDVEIDEVLKALAHRRAGTRAAGLRRTKNSKPHDHRPYSRRAPVLVSNAGDSASMSALSKNIRGRATELIAPSDHPLTLKTTLVGERISAIGRTMRPSRIGTHSGAKSCRKRTPSSTAASKNRSRLRIAPVGRSWSTMT